MAALASGLFRVIQGKKKASRPQVTAIKLSKKP